MLDEWTEVLAALSLATDLANGHDYEKTLRSSVLAVGLAEASGRSPVEVRDVFHTTLLRFIGCTSFAHEEALLFGDDIEARHAFATVDYTDKAQLWRAGGEAMRTESPFRRFTRRGAAILRAPASLQALFNSQCEVGMRLGTRLQVGAPVVAALGEIHERWDGRGGPAGLEGEELGRVVRVVQVANLAELVHRRLGLQAALDVIRQRRGTALDPVVCDAFVAHARGLLLPLDAGSTWDAFVAMGVRFPTVGPEHTIDDAIAVFADFADLASVYTLGHASAVAHATVTAADHLGLAEHERADLRRAALLHDLGRVAVPASVWEKKQPLTAADWERIRLHAYYGQRILDRAPTLRQVTLLACADHERCDGSGYPRAVDASTSPVAARVLAAADVHCALLEDRPHRTAFSREGAEVELRNEAKIGRLHPDAVDAVLGTIPRGAPRLPAGLTAREVEVLERIARGDTNKEAAACLGISPRTVGHHLSHAFEKIGVSTRAAAALFAVEHGLVRSRGSR